jgi:hypothetical protein
MIVRPWGMMIVALSPPCADACGATTPIHEATSSIDEINSLRFMVRLPAAETTGAECPPARCPDPKRYR